MTDDLLALAGRCLMVGFAEPEPPPVLLERIATRQLGGVILFTRNITGARQVAELTMRLRGAHPAGGLLVGIDQEGGRVQRLREPLALWPPMQRLGQLDDVALTEAVGGAIGADLRRLGFNLDFAPVLDVVVPGEGATPNTVIGDRSFGADPELVARHGLALARGLLGAGVLPCGKHFPGHGGPVTDSHQTLPVEGRHALLLRSRDLPPFRAAALAGLPLLMSAHVVYLGLDAMRPATLSHTICTDLLRGELGFKGVLVSDDMEMAAVAADREPGDAALAAMRAGVDLLLVCHREDRQQAVVQALARAAGSSSRDLERLQEAAGRVEALSRELPEASPIPDSIEESVAASRHAELLDRLARQAK